MDESTETAPEAATEPVLTIAGKDFPTITRVPRWALMKLASSYRSKDDIVQMAGMYDFLQVLVKSEHLTELDEHLDAQEEDFSEELDEAIGNALVAIANRPKATAPSSSPSSDGSSSTEEPPLRRVVSLSPAAPDEAGRNSSTG